MPPEVINALRLSLRDLCSCLTRRSALLAFFLLLAAALPIYFTLQTRLIWEDFFITYRYSENLARGHGLVYFPGERVHGFTSVLNTLLPALFAFVLQARDFVAPLWLYRGVSLAALLFGLIAATSLLTGEQASSRIRFFVGAVFPLVAVLEIKTTAFAMSGQEAGLMIGFLAPAFAAAYLGWSRHYLLGGLLWAGLMYTRPDGCVYIAVIALVAVIFETGPRRPVVLALGKSALMCGLLYLPWFLFTWGYYGSPIPHTITAKHGVKVVHSAAFGVLAPLEAGLGLAPSILCRALAPIYDPLLAAPTSWPKWLHDVITTLELIAVLYWAVPSRDRLGRMASLASFFVFCYLTYTNLVAQYAPWYMPPLAVLSLLTLVRVIAVAAARNRDAFWGGASAVLMVSGLLLVLGFMFFLSLRPIRIKQELIEWGNRREIGLWLKDRVRPGESVYLESLGYIGYFSQCSMLDWPGLVSPRVVAARRKVGHEGEYTWGLVAEELKPAWIVARPGDMDLMRKSEFLSKNYDQEKLFSVQAQLVALGEFPGISMTYGEANYAVYHRKN